jgi:four helix bundle suffix protein
LNESGNRLRLCTNAPPTFQLLTRLIHQANFLLDKQIRRLEQDFIKVGGIRERMTKARLQYRNQ